MGIQEKLELDAPIFDLRLFEVAGTPITVATLVTFALIVLTSVVASIVVRRAIRRLLVARGVSEDGSAGVASRLIHYAVIMLGLAVGLHTVGINLGALFAAGALFAVGIGFAMQNLMSNFVSGLILLLERSIKPGDIIEVDGQMLRVKHMAMRATVARSLDDEDVIVPNSDLVQAAVRNFTLRDPFYRLRTTVGVTYNSDMTLVRRVLEETALKLDWRLQDHTPKILMSEFGDSAVNFEVSVWIDDPWQTRSRKSDINEAIWMALKEAGIVIAFPQMDVHFDPPVEEAIRKMPRAV